MEFIKTKAPFPFHLQEFADEYEIDKDELRAFHNSHCTLFETMPENYPKYIETIYLPLDIYKKRIDKLVPNFQISVPDILSNNKYGILITYSASLQIHFEVNIERAFNNVLIVNRSNFYVNDKTIELNIEEMIEKVQEPLYPMHLKINAKGEIIKLLNAKEILVRWENKRKELTQFYKKQLVEKMLSKLDKFYTEIEENIHLINQNTFFGLFFLPIYRNYNISKQEKTTLFFPSLKEKVCYETQFKIEAEYSESKRIQIQILGNEMETYINKNNTKGQLDLHFQLHPKSYEIIKMNGFASTFVKEEEIKMQFEIYNLSIV